MSTAALSTLSARLLLALTLLLAPALAPWHGADGQPLRLATAWADDGDGDGGGGGNGGDASTGPYPWGDHSRPATRPARRAPKRRAPAPPPPPSDLVPNELLALNPSAAALERASALGATALETIAAAALELRVVRLRLPAGLTARNALAQLVRTDPGVFEYQHRYTLAQSRADPAAAARCEGPACGTPGRLAGWPA